MEIAMPTKKRIQYRYTITGQRSALIDPDGGRFTYTYDSVKRLTQVINPQGERTSYSYDADPNVLRADVESLVSSLVAKELVVQGGGDA